ncbi:hypothetical protein N5B55_24505 (plasmid) [Ralstonia pickettii]|uniref:hypothetical protein n=1 Tax=Ralstonia TaxID=48736 RepID=UPI00271490AD|nr:hypothetical protein [Ralstonia pickettii]WKZ88431.1 hypothetical protein N5B55_24505 [Ralstonia pickettii]
MKVHVTPLKIKGVFKQKWMRAMGNARGVLYVGDRRDTINQRSTIVAELRETDDPAKKEWMLFDARLVWAKESMFLLAGYERRIESIDTITDYAQTWLVRIPTRGDGEVDYATDEAAAPTEQQVEAVLAEAGV